MGTIVTCSVAFLLALTTVNGDRFHYWEQQWTYPADAMPPAEERPGSGIYLCIAYSRGVPHENSFECPGPGRYALRQPRKSNCGKYYECPGIGYRPMSLMECPGELKFNRLSRTCLEKNHVSCKWCTREGRHEDITSSSHFIECVPGSVAIRYKCRNGKYNPRKRECKEKVSKIMDITVDAELALPMDIVKFQQEWNTEQDADKDKGRSIELDESSQSKKPSSSSSEGDKKKKQDADSDAKETSDSDKKKKKSDDEESTDSHTKTKKKRKKSKDSSDE